MISPAVDGGGGTAKFRGPPLTAANVGARPRQRAAGSSTCRVPTGARRKERSDPDRRRQREKRVHLTAREDPMSAIPVEEWAIVVITGSPFTVNTCLVVTTLRRAAGSLLQVFTLSNETNGLDRPDRRLGPENEGLPEPSRRNGLTSSPLHSILLVFHLFFLILTVD